jgi:hypothetical protein
MDVIGAVSRLQDSFTRRKTKQEKKPFHKKDESAAATPQEAAATLPRADSSTQIGNLIDTSA